MCVVEMDEFCDVWNETSHKARKEHTCDTCRRTIVPGETYHRYFMLFDGYASDEKECLQCREVAVEFQEGHRVRMGPSGMTDMYQECVWNSQDEGDEESATKWQGVLDAIAQRRKDSRKSVEAT